MLCVFFLSLPNSLFLFPSRNQSHTPEFVSLSSSFPPLFFLLDVLNQHPLVLSVSFPLSPQAFPPVPFLSPPWQYQRSRPYRGRPKPSIPSHLARKSESCNNHPKCHSNAITQSMLLTPSSSLTSSSSSLRLGVHQLTKLYYLIPVNVQTHRITSCPC